MKSLLKNIIQEVYKVDDRNNITFEVVDGIFYRIGVNGTTVFGLTEGANPYCCGISEMGDTIYNVGVNNKRVIESDESLVTEFYVRCMNQIVKMLKNEVSEERLRTGLACWTHTTDNPVVEALLSPFGKENSLWIHTNTFYNPNSNNTVVQFSVDINKEE